MDLSSHTTKIIGILNITPDSFSDGGLYFQNTSKALHRVETMLSEGADIIDIGGESTRPGAKLVDEEEELDRILPVIQSIRHSFGNKILLSVDTYKSGVALKVLSEGVNIINSLSGFTYDHTLASIIAQFHCPIIIYHIQGIPETMQKEHITYGDVIREISSFFQKQISMGQQYGIKEEQFILDPGIGFGKTVTDNLEIIRRFAEFKTFHLPLAVGVSRKSHLGMILQETFHLPTIVPVPERLEAALAETAVAILHGASFVRTHDVLATKRFLTLFDQLK